MAQCARWIQRIEERRKKKQVRNIQELRNTERNQKKQNEINIQHTIEKRNQSKHTKNNVVVFSLPSASSLLSSMRARFPCSQSSIKLRKLNISKRKLFHYIVTSYKWVNSSVNEI